MTTLVNLTNLNWTLGAGIEYENLTPQHKLEKKFGQSPVFVASTLLKDGGTLKNASPASLLKEAIHVISCGYEDKTEWGKEVRTYYVTVEMCKIFSFES